MELLTAVARDAVRALKAVEEDDELAADAEAAGLLREIVGQEFEDEDDEVPRPRRGRRTRPIVSAHDPEMRHGRTTPSRRFTGSKLHAAAAAEAPLLTAISVAAADEHDGHQAGALVDQQTERRRPKRLIGDTAYGNIEARQLLEERSVAVLAPVHSSSPREGTIPKDEFQIDLETNTVTRPRGKTAPIHKPRRNRPSATGERVARFARSDCEPRPPQDALLADRPARHPHQPPRGPAPGRAPGVIRPRRARPSQAHRAADRAAARDSSSTATEDARAATAGPENRPSRPPGPPSSSTPTRSGPPCGPSRHRSEPGDGTHTRGHPEPAGRERPAEALVFSGLVEEQAPRRNWFRREPGLSTSAFARRPFRQTRASLGRRLS
jgi:hypothetical protein